jgi:predicted metal-dependent phosphoesterase TrpH
VTKASTAGFKALAITDHDNMDAHRQLRGENGFQGLRIIPGIELSCEENGREVHILGYYLDVDDAGVVEYENISRVDRDRRGREMVDNLRRSGVNVTYAELTDQAAGAPITRPHLATLLVQKGYAANISEAFHTWLDRGRVGYAARRRFSVRDAVNLIRTAGGVSVAAHPGRTYQDPRLFLSLLTLGIDGLEVHHPSHWNVTREYYRLLAVQHHLLVTGGSDYHGSREYDERNFGTFGATEEMVDALHTKALQRQIHGNN